MHTDKAGHQHQICSASRMQVQIHHAEFAFIEEKSSAELARFQGKNYTDTRCNR